MNDSFDRRVTPIRDDLAAEYLRDQIQVDRYTSGIQMQIKTGFADLRKTPSEKARLDTQLLFGETFTVYDEDGDWVWGQCETDAYVGYTGRCNLSPIKNQPEHFVTALRTYLYPGPDLKLPPIALLSLGSRVCMDSAEKFANERFAKVDGGYVFAKHIQPIDDFVSDYVFVAELFLGTPYYWGGRTSIGLDCSALVQLAVARLGLACPRDTDLQETMLGEEISVANGFGDLTRGDLVFWRGHVAIMVDSQSMIHANATNMAVTIDPLAEFAAGIEPSEGPVTSIKRLR